MSLCKPFHPSALALALCLAVAGCGDDYGEPAGGGERAMPDQGATGVAPGEAMPDAHERSDAAGGPEADEGFALGAPREDLQRFYGVYGDPANPGRDFFVTEAKAPLGSDMEVPPGYLMIGAVWGDVAPWYMESVSDTRFEQRWVGDFGNAVIAAFDLGGDGSAVALTFETVFDERGRLERLRDLPKEWQ